MRNVWGRWAFTGTWSERSPIWNQVAMEDIPSEGIGCAANGVFWIATYDFFRLVAIFDCGFNQKL